MNLKVKPSISYIIILLFPYFLFSQAKNSTINNFLKSYEKDSNLTQSKQQIEFNQQLNYQLPYINSIMFRAGIAGSVFRDPIYGDFINEDTYNLSIETNSIKKITLQKQLKQLQSNVLMAKNDEMIHQILSERYEILIDLYITENNLATYDPIKKSLEQKRAMLNLQLNQGVQLDIKNIVEVENDLQNILQKIVCFKSDSIKIQNKISSLGYIQPLNTKNFEWIKVNTIKKFMNTLNYQPEHNTECQAIKNNILYKEKEVALNKAKNFYFFKGIQIGYDQQVLDIETPDNQKSRNNYAIRANFNIPLSLSYKRELNYIQNQLKLNDLKNVLSLSQINQQTIFNNTQKELSNLIANYENLVESFEQSLIYKIKHTPTLVEKLNLTSWLDLEISYQKQQISIAELYHKILFKYFQLLKINHLFNQTPNINYLSNSLEMMQ